MGMMNTVNARASSSAHLVAQAALVLAEQAYADGKADDAAYLVDVAHRLFGAALESSCFTATVSH